MRSLSKAVLAVAVLVAAVPVASAQRAANTGAGVAKFWEFGMDFVSVQLELDPGDNTNIGFGSGALRVGRSIAPAMTLEPSITFGRTSGGGASASALNAEVGLLYHLQSDRAAQQLYVRPLVIFQHTGFDNGTTSGSDNNAGFGVGFGVKRPSKKNNRFVWRGEATYRNVSVSGTTFSDLTFSGGVSVYNH